MSLSTLAAAIFVLTTACVVAGVVAVTRRAGAPSVRTRSAGLTAVAVCAWLIVTALLAAAGALDDFRATPPQIVPVVLAGNLAAIAVATSPLGRTLIRVTPIAWLVGLQSFRLGVEICLALLHHAGSVPVQMTIEGRNWDMLVGLSAAPLAWLAARGRVGRGGLLAWNLAGLALLLNIVAISVLSMPTPLRAFTEEPANTIIATAPYVWLPTFLVPAALCLHLLALRKMLAGRSAAVSATPASA